MPREVTTKSPVNDVRMSAIYHNMYAFFTLRGVCDQCMCTWPFIDRVQYTDGDVTRLVFRIANLRKHQLLSPTCRVLVAMNR